MNKLYSYVATVSKDDPRHLRAAYARISKTSEEQYMTVAEKLIEEGRQQGLQQGLQQGRQEGRQEGAQRTLLMQIEQRFGALQPSVVQRIENASQGEIDRWLRRILTAATLDDLLT
jgi:predicted transposase YdaD